MTEKQFQEGVRVTLTKLSEATGIHRVTLSKMINHRGYSTVTDNLDRLCAFFGCRIEQLVEHIPDANSIEKQLTDKPKRAKKQEPPKGDSC